jgi:hypothetical protein
MALVADWRRIAARLALALKSMPCRCEYARNARGVPTWSGGNQSPLERTLTKECSRCVALKMYNGAEEVAAPMESQT